MKKVLAMIGVFFVGSLIFSQENVSITQQQVDNIMKAVERLRQVTFKEKINFEVLSRDEILKHIKEEINRQYSNDQLLYEEAVLKLFRLVDKDFNLEKLFTDLYKEQAGGMYDYTRRSLYVADWIPAEIQQHVLFHELIHALTDQYYPVKEYVPTNLTSDKKLARAAVIEGEGTYFMLLYALDSLGMSLDDVKEMVNLDMIAEFQDFGAVPGMEVASTAPRFIQGQVLFPYLRGIGFLNKFLKENAIEKISMLYENPPSSTEQILHIEKYRKDEPVDVTLNLDEHELKGWSQVHTDDIGEYNLLLMLKERLSVEESRIASEGWGGDKYVLLKQGSIYALMYKSRWDTERDAKEFYNHFIKWFGGKQNKLGDDVWLEDGDLNCLIAKKNSTVIMMIGAMDKEFASIILRH